MRGMLVRHNLDSEETIQQLCNICAFTDNSNDTLIAVYTDLRAAYCIHLVFQ